MKATDLNQAFNYVDQAYLMEADTPEKENQTMKNKKRTFYIFLAAALICLMSITAYAAELLNIHSYQSSGCDIIEKYADINRTLTRIGLEAEIPEGFSNGFRFQRAKVQAYDALDENDEQLLTMQELYVYYRNEQGQEVTLVACVNLEGLPKDERAPASSKTVGEAELEYYQDVYRFVPEDYQPSEAEKEWSNQPGHYISYGADEVREQIVSFLRWTQKDVCYSIMDWNTVEPDVLFAMAEEMIR